MHDIAKHVSMVSFINIQVLAVTVVFFFSDSIRVSYRLSNLVEKNLQYSWKGEKKRWEGGGGLRPIKAIEFQGSRKLVKASVSRKMRGSEGVASNQFAGWESPPGALEKAREPRTTKFSPLPPPPFVLCLFLYSAPSCCFLALLAPASNLISTFLGMCVRARLYTLLMT